MDVFLAALLSVAGTLGGVGLSGLLASRSEARRLEASALENDRQAERAAAAARAAEEGRLAAEAADIAAKIRDLFLDELRQVRLMGDLAARDFDEKFQKAFDIDGDIKLRRAIGAVRDNDQRAQLSVVVDTLSRVSAVSSHNFRVTGFWAENAIKLGADLAAAFARRQELDASLRANFYELNDDLKGYLDYQQAEWTIRMEEERERFMDLVAKRTREKEADQQDHE